MEPQKKRQTLTVSQEPGEWVTAFEGGIKDVKIDGVEIMKIHNLALKCNEMQVRLEKLAKTYTLILSGIGVTCILVTVLFAINIPPKSMVREVITTVKDTNQRTHYMIDVLPRNRVETTFSDFVNTNSTK